MKKRILFVGREQPLWAEFHEHAADPDSNWTVSFAGNGKEALDVMDRLSIDAAVVDVELSGMTGVDLLDQVMRRQPRTIRMVVSDVADAQSTVKCIGRAHHHLFKPCEAATVINALNDAMRLEASLPSDTVRSLIAQMRWVPSPPSIYSKILSEMRSSDVSVDVIGSLIGQDPALTAKVLQIANSAVFGLHLQVTAPTEAVGYIGLQTARALVLLAHTFSSFDQLLGVGFSAETLWQHSLITGHFARNIVEQQKAGAEMAEQSFAAGLLHDIGKLLFAANLPGPFSQALAVARAQNLSLWEAENAVFGATHAEVGGCVLAIWGLPMPVVEAVTLHHCPSKCLSEEFGLVTAVHVANAFEHNPSAPESEFCPKELDADYIHKLGLDQRIAEWRSQCFEARGATDLHS
ncbi:MAG TPA: response regulator [Verrucomicrobiae bacterium]|nr:response regulator [Verrucomicrobiae bacterium]